MVRDMMEAQDSSTNLLNLISRIARSVASASGDTTEEQQTSQEDYVATHHLQLVHFAAGVLTRGEDQKASALTEGMLRLLQLLRKAIRGAASVIGSLPPSTPEGGNVHRFLKGGQQPDTIYSRLFGGIGITTDPAQVRSEKLAQWCSIWKCDDAEARLNAFHVIRKDSESDGYGSACRRF